MPPSQKRKTPYDDDEPCDGYREPGPKGCGGWWISLEEAQEKSVGWARWFETANGNGVKVKLVQHVKDAPRSKPVWRFTNGDMYLGGWKEKGPNAHPVEEGFGICYTHFQYKYRGFVYIGAWVNGEPHGIGESFWLTESKTWTNNHFPGSAITSTWLDSGRDRGIPFTYRGGYRMGAKSDMNAIVTLKDGTTRIGPWKNGKPVGRWYSHPLAQDLQGGGSAAMVAALKQEPPEEKGEVISLSGTDDEDANTQFTPQSKTKQESECDSEFDRKKAFESRIHQIRGWIMSDVIGHNPIPYTMENYAKEFLKEGYESIEMIKAFLEEEDIKSFSWLAPLHKKIFCKCIKNGW